jgi:hypothetical protein
MRSVQHSPVEALELNLVAPEVLCVDGRGHHEHHQDADESHAQATSEMNRRHWRMKERDSYE